MKGKNKSLIRMLPAVVALAFVSPALAQDDLYYDPSTDSRPVPTSEQTYEEPNNVTRRYDDSGDDQYYEEDDYAYEYSSRIRRFHRPASAVDYYDPFFVDLYHYDPYYLPGASIYTYGGYGDYWAWRRYQRWRSWNSWNPWNPYAGYGWGVGWNSWSGWGVNAGWGGGGFNPWYSPNVWNRYYYDPYWTWNGYNPYYDNFCGASYGHYYYNNQNYYNNGNNNGGYQPRTYTGPRRGGTTVNRNGYARLTNGTGSNGRLLAADNSAPSIEMKSRPNGRATVDKATPSTGQAIDRATQSSNGRGSTPVTRDPASNVNGRNSDKTEKTRPTRDIDTDAASPRRPSQGTETRPSRSEETRPTRREETRPSRSEETRPTRQPAQETRPSRPSSEDRPSRSGGGTETRPSRSNDSGGSSRSWDSSPSRSSGSSSGSSGSSGSRSSGGSSSGSKTSGGGSRGRN